MSQAALAKAVGLSRTSITNIEQGRQPVNIHTLYAMADILGVEVGDLLPPSPKDSLGMTLGGDQEQKELAKLSSKESSWLQKIAQPTPNRTRK
jgi:transcriptional regulator with XRE-family HTH domain